MARRSFHFLGGWTFLVLLFLYLPIAVLFIFSFNRSQLNILWSGFTFKWYAKVWQDRPLIDALKNSLIVAFFATLMSVPLGTASAWVIHRYRFPLRWLIATISFIPVIMPEVVIGLSLLIFFGLVSQWGNSVLGRLGLGDNILGLGYTTVILAHATFCFPFVMIPVQARLAGLDPSLEEAAMDLGATPLRAFLHVMIPYLLPSIVAGALMAFTLSLDEYIVTYFTKSPDSATLPIRIFDRAKIGLSPTLNVISVIFIVSTAILAVCAEYLRRKA